MPEIGATVLFLDGTAGKLVEAEVVSVNEDETINILYPHPFAPDVRATCDSVQVGTGTWQWQAKTKGWEKAAAAEATPAEPVEELPTEERGGGVTIHRKITSTRSRGITVD